MASCSRQHRNFITCSWWNAGRLCRRRDKSSETVAMWHTWSVVTLHCARKR